jgi:hypothetical protein
LFVKHEPSASITGKLVKFSLAISSIPHLQDDTPYHHIISENKPHATFFLDRRAENSPIHTKLRRWMRIRILPARLDAYLCRFFSCLMMPYSSGSASASAIVPSGNIAANAFFVIGLAPVPGVSACTIRLIYQVPVTFLYALNPVTSEDNHLFILCFFPL